MAKAKPKLRTLRLQRKRTLKDMADEIGCSESFLSRLETGRAGLSIDPDLARRVGDAYKCRIRLQAGQVVR